MKRLLKYLKNYKKESILSPLFKMLEASFELMVPLVVASMIDKGIGDGVLGMGDKDYLLKCFLMLVLLGLIGLISSCTAQFFAAKAATGFSMGLRHDLFEHLLSLSYKEIDNVGTSAMITRMTSDVNTVQNGVNMFLRLFLRSPFIVAGAMVMAFTIDVKSALVFAGVIAILSIAVYVIMHFNIPMLKTVQASLDNVLNLTRENLSGVRVIRAFVREKEEYEGFKGANEDLTNLQLKAGRIAGLLNPLTYVIINTAIVLLIKVGALQVERGILTTGEVVALYNYMSQILLELIKFAGLIVTINKALASANRINEAFEIPKEGEGTLDIDIESIEFKKVCLRYHEASDESLTDISFKVKRGETLGIIGGTGSGKTSVINLIGGFYEHTGGDILINGSPITDNERIALRKNMGIAMQKAVLFSGTIRDNLKWGNENATDEELMAAARAACALDVIEVKGGLDGEVEAGGKNLSGGQRQRLTIARALLKRPQVLILDDSSSALDYVTDLKLRTNLKSLDYDPIVIIVSQRTSAVQSADRIVVLDDGNEAGCGEHETLLNSCGIYREIYETQFKKEAI